MNYTNCGLMGSMGGWMLIGAIIFGVLVLVIIGLVAYWAIRLAMRHEIRSTSSSAPKPLDPPH